VSPYCNDQQNIVLKVDSCLLFKTKGGTEGYLLNQFNLWVVNQMRTKKGNRDNNSIFERCVQAKNKDVLIVSGQIYNQKVGVGKRKDVLNAMVVKDILPLKERIGSSANLKLT